MSLVVLALVPQEKADIVSSEHTHHLVIDKQNNSYGWFTTSAIKTTTGILS
jgi:hypothetical protein